MTKITIPDLTASYASVTKLNEYFQLLEDELNDKVLYRDNPIGEANSMSNDLDMDSNDVLNASNVQTSTLTLNGVPVTSVDEITNLPDASRIIFIPAGNILATDVQAAIEELDNEKAPTVHTHVEADITDLDKYTQAQVNGLLALKIDTSDIGVTVQAYDIDTAKLDVNQLWAGSQRSPYVVDNDLSFDMDLGQNFKATLSGIATLTFTNLSDGQSGSVWLDNTGGNVISKDAAVLMDSNVLTTISTSGVYILGYECDGTNIAITSSQALS